MQSSCWKINNNMNYEYMIAKEKEDESTFDFQEIFRLLLRKIPVIVLVGLIFAVVTLLGTKLLITPMYTSQTKVYILTRQSDSGNTTYSDLQMGSYLTKDYLELVKSRPVMEQTIAKLNLNMKVDELRDAITIQAVEDTRILAISVSYPDPEMAQKIADVVREESSVQITEIMEADAVNVVEKANLPTEPSSPHALKNGILSGMLGVILTIGIIILLYVSDDTIKTSEDVKKYLGLNVLTSVPLSTADKRARKANDRSYRSDRNRKKRR